MIEITSNAIAKSSLTDGHEHTIIKRDDGTYTTSEQYGASSTAHAHAVIVSDGELMVLRSAGHSHGVVASLAKSLGGLADAEPPFEALSKKLTAFCAANKIEKVWTDGLEAFEATDEGAALKVAYDESIHDAGSSHRDVETSLSKNDDAFEALSKGLTSFCKREGISQVWTYGLAAFEETPEGKALSAAVGQ